MKTRVEIPFRLPSLNEYIRECRGNKYSANTMKQRLERDIGFYLKRLPEFKKPIRIDFEWVEENKKRDPDNIDFAKKFILDAMVKYGKIKNDNGNYIAGFKADFSYAKESKVILNIYEVDE